MATTKAGRYNEILLSAAGALLPNTSVTVRLPNTTTAATLYTDENKGTTAANPTTTDSFGNLSFWADWDTHYDLLANGTTIEDVAVTPGHTALVPRVETQAGTAAAPTPKEIWRFNAPTGDTHGPFTLVVGGAAFAGTFDRTMYFGYNVADGGGRQVAAEPSFRFALESDYFNTNHYVEGYFEYAKGSGATGPVSFRPIFFAIDRANGTLQFELNSTTGISFNSTDGAQTNWAQLSSTGLTITPYAGQNATLVLGWKTGGQNFIQINNNTNGFLLQPIGPGNATWEMRVGANRSFSFNLNGFEVGEPAGAAGVVVGRDGAFRIYNAAGDAILPMLRNISNEMYVGGNATWTGISFQAGGSTIVRFTPTLLAFHGAAGSAQKSAVTNADGTLADITTKFNAMLAYWRSRGDVAP